MHAMFDQRFPFRISDEDVVPSFQLTLESSHLDRSTDMPLEVSVVIDHSLPAALDSVEVISQMVVTPIPTRST